MLKIFTHLMLLLDPKDKIKLSILSLSFFLTALLDVVGLAFLVPFVNLIVDPSLIHQYSYTSFFNEIFGFESDSEFILYFGLFLLFYLIFSQLFRMLTIFQQIKFTYSLQYSLTKNVVYNYLSNDYEFFTKYHSADLSKDILSEISVKVVGLIIPSLQLFSSSLLVLSISCFLFYLDFISMSIIVLLFGCMYGGLILTTKRYQTRIGVKRYNANSQMFKILNNILTSIKEVKFYGAEQLEAENFNVATSEYCKAQSKSQALSILPKYVVELVVFSMLIILSLILNNIKRDPSLYFSIIIPFTFGVYKILPALQQIFFCISQLRFNSASLDSLDKVSYAGIDAVDSMHNDDDILSFSNYLELENITYTHPNEREPILKNLNLIINANSMLGIKGPSGSGKSTLINILLGIAEPQSGAIIIDGVPLAKQMTGKLNSIISYVPQEVFIIDDTLAKNITLYSGLDDINYEWLDEVIKLAELEHFVHHELSNGQETVLGERGSRISGGQKQRIGLARALYRRPELLILDEATSALDFDTERKILERINDLRDKMAVVIVAHRMQSFEFCDTVHDMQLLNDH